MGYDDRYKRYQLTNKIDLTTWIERDIIKGDLLVNSNELKEGYLKRMQKKILEEDAMENRTQNDQKHIYSLIFRSKKEIERNMTSS